MFFLFFSINKFKYFKIFVLKMSVKPLKNKRKKIKFKKNENRPIGNSGNPLCDDALREKLHGQFEILRFLYRHLGPRGAGGRLRLYNRPSAGPQVWRQRPRDRRVEWARRTVDETRKSVGTSNIFFF
jgi:hypothetical protein